MSTATIFELSARMEPLGFQFGAMIGLEPFRRTDGSRSKLKNSFFKPEDAMYFSKIQDAYPEDDDAGHAAPKTLKTLGRYNWIMDEDFRVEKYSMKDLLFAKFDESKLVSSASERFVKGGDFHVVETHGRSSWELTRPDWQKVGTEYGGIHVDRCNTGLTHVFDDWFFETVAIWDLEVLTDVQWFRNAGKPWTYEVLSVSM
jgi:hypothetical protein